MGAAASPANWVSMPLLQATETASIQPTCQVYQVQAAMSANARHIIDSVHHDGQDRMAAAAALIHLGLCHSPVPGPSCHHLQHIFCRVHRHLQQ